MVRFKNRYILGQLQYNEGGKTNANLSNFNFLKACKENVQQLFGEYGFAQIVTSFQSNVLLLVFLIKNSF